MEEQNEKIKENHGQILRNELERLGMGHKELAETIDVSPRTVQNWLYQPELKKTILTTIFHYYDMIEAFGYTREDFLPFDPHWKKENPVTYFFFEEAVHLVEPYKGLVEAYFGYLKKIINEAKEKIGIYDYLARTKNETLGAEVIFRNAQKEYFNYIYKHFIANTDIQYSRIIVLPLEEGENRTKDDSVKEAIHSLFSEAFYHIWQCLKSDTDKFELFVCSKPSRLYSFGTIDNNITIKEHDRYDKNGIPHPDMMLIYKLLDNPEDAQDKSFNTMVNFYQFLMVNLIREGRNQKAPVWRIRKNEFAQKTILCYDEAKTELSDIQSKILDKKLEKGKLSLDGKNERIKIQREIGELTDLEYNLKLRKENLETKLKIISY